MKAWTWILCLGPVLVTSYRRTATLEDLDLAQEGPDPPTHKQKKKVRFAHEFDDSCTANGLTPLRKEVRPYWMDFAQLCYDKTASEHLTGVKPENLTLPELSCPEHAPYLVKPGTRYCCSTEPPETEELRQQCCQNLVTVKAGFLNLDPKHDLILEALPWWKSYNTVLRCKIEVPQKVLQTRREACNIPCGGNAHGLQLKRTECALCTEHKRDSIQFLGTRFWGTSCSALPNPWGTSMSHGISVNKTEDSKTCCWKAPCDRKEVEWSG